MSKILIVGGGAAGMMAAIAAAEKGHEVHLFEKNEKLGKKLFITGKGRCNLTNACDMEELFDSICTNQKFLYSAFYGLTNQATMEFFETCGLRLKVERGNRVFPQSDHSSDVIRILQEKLKQLKVKLHMRTEVTKVLTKQERVSGVQAAGQAIDGDAVIVATGGISYPSTGATGDGYRFAKENHHTITKTCPSLVPFNTKEEWVPRLQGLSLKNVKAAVYSRKKCLFDDLGEMMFTHFGVTGPLILTASSMVHKELSKQGELGLYIDLKPALTKEQLDKRILRDFEEVKNKQFKNAINKLFPAKLIPLMLELSGIDPEKKVNEISKGERGAFVTLIKGLPLTITGLRGYNEAIITKGGIKVQEINPGTMESRLVAGLYFVGEVLDLDAVTGGFNLQIAWSTGYAAGSSVL